MEKSSSVGPEGKVIVIVIDALRADHVGCYGYERDTTPHIDSFAQESVVFENCYVQATWTKPSVASLLTSLYPTMHGTISHGSILPEEATTIAEVFKDKGYLTYGYVANPNLKTKFRFNQGFDFFDDLLMRDKFYYVSLRNLQKRFKFLRRLTGKSYSYSDRDNIALANSRIFPWLERYKGNNFFMYIHYMDPHDPYRPPSPYDREFSYSGVLGYSQKLSLYDGEILFTDEHLGLFFDKLKSTGIYDESLIVITSDHGEAFGDHGDWRHGYSIYNELAKVPLIIKYPNSEHGGKRVSVQVRSIDVFPSLLDATGIESKAVLEGSSVSCFLGSSNAAQGRDVYIDNDYNGRYILEGIIRDNTWKYIYTKKSLLRDVKKFGHEELYNLQDDPKELLDLSDRDNGRASSLQARMDFFRKLCSARRLKRVEAGLDPETLRNLKSLGYLEWESDSR
ncbi:MAG: sulfatase [Planctomycetota bacterium]